MQTAINLTQRKKPNRDGRALNVGRTVLTGSTEVRQLSYFQASQSRPTTAQNDSDMSSCGCSVEKCKSTGWQGKPVTPTEPNSIQKRAVINYGDKQHFRARSL